MNRVVGHRCLGCGTWFLFADRARACREAHIPQMAARNAPLREAYAAYRRAYAPAVRRWLANGRPPHLAVWF